MTKILLALGILGAFAIVLSPFATATPEYAKKEDKQCVYCHTAVGKPDLNDAGKYYKDNNHSLQGYGQKKP